MEQKRKGPIRRLLSGLWSLLTWIRMSLANLVFLVLIVLVIVTLTAERRSVVPERGALVIAPTGSVVEQLSFVDPIARLLDGTGQRERETLLKDILDAIDEARDDPRIQAIVLALDGMDFAGLSKTRDIGKQLEAFRASGKKVIAIGDYYSQDQYLLAAQADEIWMHPLGSVELNGYGVFGNYYAAALEKLKIDMHVFRSGTYKSAYEFLERSDMSTADREATSDLLGRLWKSYTTMATGRRQIPAESIDHYANHIDEILKTHAGDTAHSALEYGLVDALKTRGEMEAALVDMVGENEDGSFNSVDFRDYVAAMRPGFSLHQKKSQAIGLIVASGMIFDGEQGPGSIGGDSLATLIRQAQDDDEIKALVLRVDSPGGSGFASEIIREALVDFQKGGKPFVVSMGSVAASGGYWIAAPADEIWAGATTLTGSIGVLSAFPSVSRALEELGIHNDGVGTTATAGGLDITRPLSPIMSNVLSLENQHVYRRFIEIVAEGRKMKTEDVARIAEGHVWTGEQAVANKLVDHIGDLDDAIAAAARLGQLKTWEMKYVEPPKPWAAQMLEHLSMAGSTALGESLTPFMKDLHAWQQLAVSLRDPHGQYAICTVCVAFYRGE